MPVYACKLPHGLAVTHRLRTVTLVGANVGERLANVSLNGEPTDNASRFMGFGLTTFSAADAELFEDWRNQVTFKGGVAKGGKLDFPFPAFENGSILGPFATVDEARAEISMMAAAVTTGFEGLDPEKEGTANVKIEKMAADEK